MDSAGDARMMSIVLADDSTTIQKVVQLTFVDENIEVRIFSDGKKALDDILANGADAVLVDISLPEMDGYELCRTLKTNPVVEHVPVILLAGTFEPFDVEKAEEVGYTGSLTKPFETSQLVSLVKELLEKEASVHRAPVSREADYDTGPGHQNNFPISPTLSPTGGDLIFHLNVDWCRPSFQLLERETIGSIAEQPTSGIAVREIASQESEALSQEQLNLLADRLSERLPDTLKSLLPGILKETLKESE